MPKRYLMTKAWQLARKGHAIYGGGVRRHFAEALRIVWAEYKSSPIAREIADIVSIVLASRRRPVGYRRDYKAAYYAASW